MNRLRPTVLIAALAATMLAAPDAAAEKRVYGQTVANVANTLRCAAEAQHGLGAYLLYETGQSLEQTLPVAMASAAAKADPKETERRLRSVYAVKPLSAPAYGTQVFQQCLSMKTVPLDYTRTGNCYLLTFYLASVVPLHKSAGLDNKQILAHVVPGKADEKFKARVQGLVDEVAARGTADPRRNSIVDVGRFLQCVAPTQPALSNN